MGLGGNEAGAHGDHAGGVKPQVKQVKPTGVMSPARPEMAARHRNALQGTGEAVLGLDGEPLLPRVERWWWPCLWWPVPTTASSWEAAGVRGGAGWARLVALRAPRGSPCSRASSGARSWAQGGRGSPETSSWRRPEVERRAFRRCCSQTRELRRWRGSTGRGKHNGCTPVTKWSPGFRRRRSHAAAAAVSKGAAGTANKRRRD